MGIVQIIDPFYTELPEDTYLRVPTAGQLCTVVSTHPNNIPMVMDVERAAPTEHFATRFSLRNMRGEDFKVKQRLPIHTLNLRDTEELLVQKAKLRPAIVAATARTHFSDVAAVLRRLRRHHLQDHAILVVPVFGIEAPQHSGGFVPLMVARIRCLMYDQFFYCPGGSRPIVEPGVARLDRLHPLLWEASPGVRSPGYIPSRIALSPDALQVLHGMLRRYFGSRDEPDLDTVRALALEALPPEYRVPKSE